MAKNLPLAVITFLLFSCSQPTEQKQEVSTSLPEILEITITELQSGYQSKEFTIEQITQAYFNRIEKLDPKLNAVIEINPDALTIAQQLDREYMEGKIRGPMHGIPVILKDNIDTHDKMPTTAGARAMQNSYPLQDSYIVQQLRSSGAIILGKSNLSEWANFHSNQSSSGWSGLGGQTNNPYDTTRNPCGSSSGSGVAVAANFCMVAIGTETNGSIVCPSNNNGIVGIKPTVGLLSRSGIIPISFTQDTPGPMARTVTDAAICLGVMTATDSADSKTMTSGRKAFTDYTPFLKPDGLKGKRIGFYTQAMDNYFGVDSAMYQAIQFMKSQGADIIEIDHISQENINGPSFQVLLYEFKDGLNKYFASLGPDAPVKTLAELISITFDDSIEMHYHDHELLKTAQEKGDLNSSEYQKALKKMTEFSQEKGIDRVMDENNLDAIVAPTGGPAWKTDLINGDNFGISSSSPAAIAGYPNITVPMGQIEGLPIGISFFGRAWSEPVLLEIAYAYEQGTQHRFQPTLE